MKQHCSGKGFRIVEGTTPVTITSPDAIKKIKNSFRKGKGYTLKPDEFQGEGLKKLFSSAKKTIGNELKQTARSAKKQIGEELKQTGREIKKAAIKEANVFVKEVVKPYLTEVVQTGIIGLAGTASALQPELAPFLIPAGLAASAIAGNAIQNFGNRPRTIQQAQTQAEIQEPLKYEDIAQDDPLYVDPHQLYRTPMRDVSQSQRGLIGFGLCSSTKYGSGLFAGGKLLARDGDMIPYPLLSPDPAFLRNRNLMSAAEQNMLYSQK
jgi:F0F1-type ATP synthase membrane subunit b/b'